MNILFAIIMMGCRHDPKVEDSQGTQPEQAAVSDCGEMVLEEGTPTAFSDCFEGVRNNRRYRLKRFRHNCQNRKPRTVITREGETENADNTK